MRAVTFDVTVPGYVLGRSLGRLTEAAVFGGLSGLRLRDMPDVPLPGDEWVGLEVLRSGICGSDIAMLSLELSPILEPFGSFPATLGHEVVAQVSEVGPRVHSVEVGQRVAVDPIISCVMRGFGGENRCPSCAEGSHSTCTRSGDEGLVRIGGRVLSPGATVGYHRDLPGGWGKRMVAHQSQLLPLDDSLDDETGVLVEPLSVGMHGVLRTRPWGDGPVQVIGSGAIALGTVWSLRAAGYRGELVAQVKRSQEADLARELGADAVVSPGPEAQRALFATGARSYQPRMGGTVYSGGGFPLTFDCVGKRDTLDQAMRFASPRGRVVVLGCAGRVSKMDLTFVWARELKVEGFAAYAVEAWRGERVHTFRVTHDLLLETRPPVADMVTHVFPLERYRDALSATANRSSSGAIKVVFDPNR